MKVLLVHNDYGKYSGEEAVVDRMASMLRESGHDVCQLRMTSAGVRDKFSGKLRAFKEGIYSSRGIRAMKTVLEREKPDVVNVHNLYPFIGPAALQECRKVEIPVVMTVHNYRLICPTGLFMRDGIPCEECLKRGNEWSCVRHNCEGALLKSVSYAVRNFAARKRRDYIDCVDLFACITDFQRRKLIDAGFPEDKLTVIPNSTAAPKKFDYSEGKYVAYSGRISREKGVDLIIEAARRHPEIPFRLAGSVRDYDLVSELPPNVRLMGYLRGDEYMAYNRDARFFVMASRCYEGFPMAILEAARYGKPVIGPAHGSFMEILSSDNGRIGLLTNPGDVDSLSENIEKLWTTPELVKDMGRRAFEELRMRYSSSRISEMWEAIFKRIQDLKNSKQE